MISLIVATDLKNGIGLNNQMPWHLPNDFKHFKALTMGKPIVMGRKTYESIGRPLPGRQNIVISRVGFSAEGVEVFDSIEHTLKALENTPEVMVIGGGMVYAAFMPLAEKIYRTLVQTKLPADAFFPIIDPQKWRLIESVPNQKDDKHAFDYAFEVWEKK